LHRESQHRQNSENEGRDGRPVQNLPVHTLVGRRSESKRDGRRELQMQ
jgi:hypothetical protein